MHIQEVVQYLSAQAKLQLNERQENGNKTIDYILLTLKEKLVLTRLKTSKWDCQVFKMLEEAAVKKKLTNAQVDHICAVWVYPPKSSLIKMNQLVSSLLCLCCHQCSGCLESKAFKIILAGNACRFVAVFLFIMIHNDQIHREDQI